MSASGDQTAVSYSTCPAPENTANESLDILFRQFEDRYHRETSDVRSTTCNMQEIVTVTEALLDQLEDRPLWKRIWQKLSGHTYRLQQHNFRNQIKLQQTNILLISAIARQNRMVMEGLRLTLEKLGRVEEDARYIREMVVKNEERREKRRRRWEPVSNPLVKSWQWVAGKARSLFSK